MNFREYLEESAPLVEGIDIDYINKTVMFNNSHENNVDTSTVLNPTYSKIDDINVTSIFKRKINDESTGGNPLVYALKGIKGWSIDDKEVLRLFRNFISIANKIQSKYDTIIIIPSTNPLNTRFLHRITKIIKSNNK